MNADRRTVLGAGAALALPALLARAFAGERASGAELDAALSNARERATAVGKPLLVIHTDVAGAGRAWGELFLHASHATWLDLALVEVVCAPRAAVDATPAAIDGVPRWGVVVETDGSTDAPRAIEGALPAGGEWRDQDRYGQKVRDRAAALAALVRAAILPDDAARARRREQSMRSLPKEMSMRNGEHGRLAIVFTETRTARLADLDRFAAALRFPDAQEGSERLADAARMRLFEHDPAGAAWEMESNYCPPCGLGFVPVESRYFLRFYAR